METILRTENLCKYYGKGENQVRAVRSADIAIKKRRIYCHCREIRLREKYASASAGRPG